MLQGPIPNSNHMFAFKVLVVMKNCCLTKYPYRLAIYVSQHSDIVEKHQRSRASSSSRTSEICSTSPPLIWVPTWWWAPSSWVSVWPSCGPASIASPTILRGWNCSGWIASFPPCATASWCLAGSPWETVGESRVPTNAILGQLTALTQSVCQIQTLRCAWEETGRVTLCHNSWHDTLWTDLYAFFYAQKHTEQIMMGTTCKANNATILWFWKHAHKSSSEMTVAAFVCQYFFFMLKVAKFFQNSNICGWLF